MTRLMGSILLEMHDKVCNLTVLGENDKESCSHLVEEHDESAKLEEDLIKRSVAVLLIALVLFSAFQATVRVELVKAETQPIWPMEGYNARHTGQCPYDTSTNNGNLKWKFKAGRRIQTSPAISPDGTIYIGSNDRCLYALNPDGTLKWKYRTNGRIWSSPAIAPDGTVYVGSNDRYLYALNPDGTLKWKYRTSHWIISASVSSPAISSDGTIYVASWDGYLSAVDSDGTLKWTFKTGWPNAGPFQHLLKKPPAWMTAGLDEITSAPAISLEGTIYIGSNNNYLYALNADGTLKWKFKTGNGIFSSPRISSDGTVYVGSWDGYLYAIGG